MFTYIDLEGQKTQINNKATIIIMMCGKGSRDREGWWQRKRGGEGE